MSVIDSSWQLSDFIISISKSWWLTFFFIPILFQNIELFSMMSECWYKNCSLWQHIAAASQQESSTQTQKNTGAEENMMLDQVQYVSLMIIQSYTTEPHLHIY